MHTSLYIWKPHPGKLNEMREMVIALRDHGRRIGGASEVNCAALTGSFMGHFALTFIILHHVSWQGNNNNFIRGKNLRQQRQDIRDSIGGPFERRLE